MKKYLMFATVLLAISCTGNKTDKNGENDSISTNAASMLADTTIYGRSFEFGMSTFSMITDAGDTLDLDRGEGHIYGNLDNEGDRFALTIHAAGTDTASVGIAVNLTNVELFTKDYAVWNGHLILSGDTVEILDLTTDSLIAKGSTKEYKLARTAQ